MSPQRHAGGRLAGHQALATAHLVQPALCGGAGQLRGFARAVDRGDGDVMQVGVRVHLREGPFQGGPGPRAAGTQAVEAGVPGGCRQRGLDLRGRRAALDFALHHGDAAALPFVLRAMHEPEHARWAGWVWQTLTGQLLADAGLVLPEPPVDLDGPLTPARQDADQGLPLPDAAAAAAHPASRLRPGPSGGEPQRMLLGQSVTEARLRAVLDPQANAVQAVRAVAAFALAHLRPELAVNLRARPAVCALQLQQLGLAA